MRSRIVAAVLLISFLLPILSTVIFAADELTYITLDDYLFDYDISAEDEAEIWYRFTDFESLAAGYIDLSELRIPYTAKNLSVLKEMLDSVLYVQLYSDLTFLGENCVQGVSFIPDSPEDLLKTGLAIDKMISEIDGLNTFSDDIKAWLLQDALVSQVSYAKGDMGGQTVKEAMLDGVCVCAGYAKTFEVLCRKCGIRCYYMTGDGSPNDHAWNILFIDGVPYYADPTWDDNDNKAIIGYVKHKYLLSSSSAFDHSQYTHYILEEFDGFNGAEWKKSCSKALYFDGDIYYVDLYQQANVYQLCRYGDPDFYISLNNSYANLVFDGKDMLVSQKKAIYKVDVKNNKLGECVYALSDEDKAAGLGIFGFMLSDGKLVMDLAKSTLYVISASTEVTRREVPYTDYVPNPECFVTCNGLFSGNQTLYIDFTGRGRTVGYYFGKDAVAGNNPYTALEDGQNTAEVNVSDAGTYYLWSVDEKEILSDMKTVDFVKTECTSSGGTSLYSVNPAGHGFFLPECIFDDDIHKAAEWKTDGSGTLIPVGHRWYYIPDNSGCVTATRKNALVYGTTRYSLDHDYTHTIEWYIDLDDSDGVLHLNGEGRTGTFLTNHPAPWAQYSGYVKKIVIGDGVTYLGTSSFRDCTEVKTVVIPKSMTNIDQSSFKYCKKLENVYYFGTKEDWNSIVFDERGGNDYLINTNRSYIRRGDLNCDGDVTSIDSNFEMKLIAGTIDKTEKMHLAGDLNTDGDVTSIDANILKKVLAGVLIFD